MKRLAHKLLACWMTASIAHLPLPVCDGDTLTSEQSTVHLAYPSPVRTSLIDIDVILLGCDAPDDPDDGPVDDDPEHGDSSGNAFPTYLTSKLVNKNLRKGRPTAWGQGLAGRANDLRHRSGSFSRIGFARNEFFSGDCCRTGMVVMRC